MAPLDPQDLIPGPRSVEVAQGHIWGFGEVDEVRHDVSPHRPQKNLRDQFVTGDVVTQRNVLDDAVLGVAVLRQLVQTLQKVANHRQENEGAVHVEHGSETFGYRRPIGHRAELQQAAIDGTDGAFVQSVQATSFEIKLAAGDSQWLTSTVLDPLAVCLYLREDGAAGVRPKYEIRQKVHREPEDVENVVFLSRVVENKIVLLVENTFLLPTSKYRNKNCHQ
jgi:hypothetical protein